MHEEELMPPPPAPEGQGLAFQMHDGGRLQQLTSGLQHWGASSEEQVGFFFSSPENMVLWSTWKWEAMTNLTEKQKWNNVDLHCVHGRSDKSHWDRSTFNLVKVRIWPTLGHILVPHIVGIWKGSMAKTLVLKRSFMTSGHRLRVGESDTDGMFTGSSRFDWSCGHAEPGAVREAKWCSQQCLLLDWQASRYVYLVCVCFYYFLKYILLIESLQD